MPYGFEILEEKKIKEINGTGRLYLHTKTNAQLLSISNNDENKVFGISFRTPPHNSTGVPHILEHSVLCGSRKYPVKEPFLELLKGSLHTFLNAFTYPDKTCYPVASQNIKDFYNLIDVYLDAVFYPRLTKYTFQQEGWHYELESIDGPLTIKGVVYSEMKGVYSSPDELLNEFSMRTLFPDTIYKYDAGGDPKEIPNLTYEEFKEFHARFYHPSNAFIWFYGNDDPYERLRFIDHFIKDFEKKPIESHIKSQPFVNNPRYISKYFMTDKSRDESKGMVTINWLLPDIPDQTLRISFMILEHILIGMPGSPLKKALIESGLGEDIAGIGLEREIKHLFFSTGLKGVALDNMNKVEDLVFETIQRLVKDKIDPDTIEAAINTIEFRFRENNTGRFPRGLALMLRALTFWIYDGNPISAISFELDIERIKKQLNKNPYYFEDMLKQYFLDNFHRTVFLFKPDPSMKEKEEKEERKRLAKIKSKMSSSKLKQIIEDVKKLNEIQKTPDPPEALAKIPVLKLEDIDKQNKQIPFELIKNKGVDILFHDIFTNGILYIDVGLDLHCLDSKYLPYIPILGKCLLEMGTQKKDFVKLSQIIGQKTGGIKPQVFIYPIKNSKKCVAKLFLRAKAVAEKAPYLLDILKEIIFYPKLDNKNRFLQIVLEEKAKYEKKLISLGHEILRIRLNSHFTESGWANEQVSGITYLFFLRNLIKDIHTNWDLILTTLQNIYNQIFNKKTFILNITSSQKELKNNENYLNEFIDLIPEINLTEKIWHTSQDSDFEAFSISSKINFVGKGACLYDLGYKFHGSALVASKYLRNSFLWEKIRVQGGAYGAFCIFDRLSGTVCFLSYRDPNVVETINIFDQSSDFLKNIIMDKQELTKAIISTISDIDMPLLPDEKGFISMRYYLTNDSEESRQKMREEILSTTNDNFKYFGEILALIKNQSAVKIMASIDIIKEIQNQLFVKPKIIHLL